MGTRGSLLEMSAVMQGTAREVSVPVTYTYVLATPDTNVKNLVSLFLRLCKLRPGVPGGRGVPEGSHGSQGFSFKNECSEGLCL